MEIGALARQVSHYLDEHAKGQTMAAPIPKLLLIRQQEPTKLSADLYEPVICLLLQGRKETIFGDVALTVGTGETLLVSHDMPVCARVLDAPYMSMVVLLDLELLRSLYGEVREALEARAVGRSASVHEADPRLVDCLSRYLTLSSDPLEARVMAPLVLREIHFRLLMAPHGGMLRQLLRHDSHASSVARAIGRMRQDFRSSLLVPELAREVGMSASSFHKHFRDITSSTPLQYQKDLRLLEARRLLAAGGLPVSTVAYEVGYQSPNQFSREYRRKFGAPPSSEVGELLG